MTNADRISAGDSATISAWARRPGPAARAVAITPATAQIARNTTVTSKNSRPLIMGSLMPCTSQAAACMAPPISTGYSTGWLPG